jgi:hypothetical protein
MSWTNVPLLRSLPRSDLVLEPLVFVQRKSCLHRPQHQCRSCCPRWRAYLESVTERCGGRFSESGSDCAWESDAHAISARDRHNERKDRVFMCAFPVFHLARARRQDEETRISGQHRRHSGVTLGHRALVGRPLSDAL